MSQRADVNYHRLISNDKLFIIGRAIEFTFIATILLLIVSIIEKGKLPPPASIEPQLYQYPKQTNVNMDPFAFEYRNMPVSIRPVANYEQWGLIVSHNDIDGFIDGYDPDSVNIKDICLIYGKNVQTDIYQQVEFWSRTWTCNYKIDSYELYRKFDGTGLANNHLLSDDAIVRDKIRHLKVGDQIYLKGMLVDYQTPKLYTWRETSTVRTDTGNGACEVFLVTELEVIKRGTPFWYQSYYLSKWLLLWLIIARILLQLFDSFITPRKKRMP